MNVRFEIEGDLLVACVSGEWTVLTAESALAKIALKLKESEKSKVLLDLTAFNVPQNDSVRFFTGTKISELLFEYKIAGFSQIEKINRLGEMTATNRGANFQMFFSKREAVDWLME